jgi:uncharacterized protein YutD
MSIHKETRILLNNLIRQEGSFFKVLDNVFGRYIVSQYRVKSEYPDEPPFYLIAQIYELHHTVSEYCKYGAARITDIHAATTEILKYKFWLYYNMHYSDQLDNKMITRFDKVVEKCIIILKLNDEITESHINLLFDVGTSTKMSNII